MTLSKLVNTFDENLTLEVDINTRESKFHVFFLTVYSSHGNALGHGLCFVRLWSCLRDFTADFDLPGNE